MKAVRNVKVAKAADVMDNKIQQLDNLIEGVAQAVETLSSVAEDNAARTEETSAAIIELREHMESCRKEKKRRH